MASCTSATRSSSFAWTSGRRGSRASEKKASEIVGSRKPFCRRQSGLQSAVARNAELLAASRDGFFGAPDAQRYGLIAGSAQQSVFLGFPGIAALHGAAVLAQQPQQRPPARQAASAEEKRPVDLG